MRTLIFILAICALSAPILAAACPADASYTGCIDCTDTACNGCKGGFRLDSKTPVKCALCPTGTGSEAENTIAATAACPLACHPTCATCSAANSATACVTCAAGFFMSSTPGTCARCSGGTGRAPISTYAIAIGGAENENAAYNVKNCDETCHVCSAAPNGENKNCVICRPGLYLSDKTKGICTWCNNGKGRGLLAAPPTANEDATSVCTATCSVANSGNCRGTGALDALYCAAGSWATLNDAKTAITSCTLCTTNGKAIVPSRTLPAASESATSCDIKCDASCLTCKGTLASDCIACKANFFWSKGTCTACPGTKTKPVHTAPQLVDEDATKCVGEDAPAGKSAHLIQIFCAMAITAYALL